jgi:ribonuclease P protein subunit POP4
MQLGKFFLADTFAVIPKEHTVFRFEVSVPSTGGEEEAPIGTGLERSPPHSLIFELHGSQLRIRPVERATKKFKQQPLDEL